MAQEPALLKVTRQGDTVQVEFLTRKILDEGNIAEIGERLSEIVEKEGHPRIIISFSAVDHLSSAALGWMRGEDPDRGGPALTNAYQQSVWVYRAINVLAEQVANIPFLFSRGERGRADLAALLKQMREGLDG